MEQDSFVEEESTEGCNDHRNHVWFRTSLLPSCWKLEECLGEMAGTAPCLL